jgi:hypothetical protein
MKTALTILGFLALTGCFHVGPNDYGPPKVTHTYNEQAKRDMMTLENVVVSRQGGDMLLSLAFADKGQTSAEPSFWVLTIVSNAKASRIDMTTHVEMQADGQSFALGDWPRANQTIVVGPGGKQYVEAVAGQVPWIVPQLLTKTASSELVVGTLRLPISAEAKKQVDDFVSQVIAAKGLETATGITLPPVAAAAEPTPVPAPETAPPAPAKATKPTKKKH